MSDQVEGKYKVFCPLSEFNWEGSNFRISNFCLIQKLESPPDLSTFEHLLSQADQKGLFFPSHWLLFDQSPNDNLSPPEKVNLFLLALWMVVPTRTHVQFRFDLPNNLGFRGGAYRYLDRFQWIGFQVTNQIQTTQLEESSRYVDTLSSIYTSYKRLFNSIVLTFRGCTTKAWQAAFICFTAAAEGILTYSDKPGVTKRLASSFACLTKSTKQERDLAYKAFVQSYRIRSDIIHGRAYNLRDPNINLKELAKLSDLIRDLWKSVLSSRSHIAELERSDAKRAEWFAIIQKNYVPPKL